jgi:serine/threonine-protein kinase
MEAGAQVGGYRIIHPIGEGGMGTVYVAEHTTLGRRAAIKMLHPMFSTRADIVTRFCNEARAASAITDPGIIQIFDVGQHTDGSAYIVMELLEGEPLDRRLRQHRTLPVDAALRIVRQVAKSLGAAHARGIVHRDLKPENIFLVPDTEVIGGERAKILDFGIAKLLGDTNLKTQTSAVMGTPAYMSPEQCRGAGSVDERADVYSLGCVLFTLLAGRPPFDAEGAGEIIAMQLREPPPALSSMAPDVSPELDALVARCLQKNPAHRFSSGSELATAISQLAAQPAAPVAAPLPAVRASVGAARTTLSTAAGSVRPTPSRKMSIAAVSAVAMLAGGAVLAPVVLSSSESPAAETPSGPASSPPAATPPEPPAVTAPAATTAEAPPAKSEPALAPSTPPSPAAPPAIAARPSESRPEPSAASRGEPAAAHKSASLQKETSDKPADAGTRSTTQASRDKKPANASGSAPRTGDRTAADPEQPAAKSPASDLPEKLDRSMILRGMALVRRSILACGTGFEGIQVRLSVTVAPDGTVSNVVVKDSPDAWLSSCLSTRMKLARFVPTRSGGAFGQSFSFSF